MTEVFEGSRCELTVTEAADVLTVAEVRAIERHFDGNFGAKREDGGIRPTDTVVGLVWAHERRRALRDGGKEGALPGWDALDEMTMHQLNAYFAEEPVEVDDDRPETTEGKEL